VQVTWPAASGANCKLAGQVRFGTGGERGNLFMANVQPRDLGLPPERVSQTVQAVTDNTVNPLDAAGGQNLSELVGYSFRHVCFSVDRLRIVCDMERACKEIVVSQ
jgi:hypothetical protein